MNINHYKTDLEETWIDGPEDSRFKIRSTDNKKYQKALSNRVKNIPRAKLNRDPEAAKKATILAVADALLLEWEGVTEGDEPLECTHANRVRILQYSELFELISNEAQDLTNFKSEALAEDAESLKSDDRVEP